MSGARTRTFTASERGPEGGGGGRDPPTTQPCTSQVEQASSQDHAPAHSPFSPPPPLCRELQLKLDGDRQRLIEAINATFGNLGAAARGLLTDTDKLLSAVGGLSLLALGVYSGEQGQMGGGGGGRGDRGE